MSKKFYISPVTESELMRMTGVLMGSPNPTPDDPSEDPFPVSGRRPAF